MIKCNNFVSNAEVLKRASIAPVDVFIRAATLRWFGHVVRMPDERIPGCPAKIWKEMWKCGKGLGNVGFSPKM